MTSNLFSRLASPSSRETRSFYNDLRSGGRRDNKDDGSRHSPAFDEEDQVGLALDEENLTQQFHDNDLEHANGLGIDGSQATIESSIPAANATSRGAPVSTAMSGARRTTSTEPGRRNRNISRPRWAAYGGGADDDGDNDDVPGSLLVEAQELGTAQLPPMLKAQPLRSKLGAGRRAAPSSRVGGAAPPVLPTTKNRDIWEETQGRQRQHQGDFTQGFDGGIRDTRTSPGRRIVTDGNSPGNALLSYFTAGHSRKSTAPDRAMWRWVNVSNLDNFIRDVYDYYRGCGLRCILLARFLHLVNVAFVAIFLTFLTQCVDYTKIRGSTTMQQILVPQCTKNMSWLWNMGLWLFAFYFIWKTMQFFVFDVRRLLHLRDFFVYLLQIPEHDMQTVSWQDVVVKIMALRDQNPKTATNMTRLQREWIGSQSKERLDAHDIANRLMRRENYLIALFNKDILNLTIPLPFLRNKQLLTRTLEWTLWFGVLDFVFDERGQVNQEFLKASRRSQLSRMLKSRFLFAGFMNLLLAPFVACYLVVVYFLTYYNEYQKNPSALGARAYTPLAEWKFREFNELEHLFEERLNMSYPFATRYLDQFPKRKTEQVAKTVAFIAGSVMTVLAIASLIDPELFLGFEITHDRTVLFYVGIFATVWATARGMVTEDNSVFDPEYALRNVIEYTHHEPDHWKGRLHSYDVKMEFSELYQLKIKIFFEEIMSIFFTPLILFMSLPRSSDQIIDFFREFTIHVDGLGYVCSFAVFDFNKGVGATTNTSQRQRQPAQAQAQQQQQQLHLQLPDTLSGGSGDVRDDYYSTKHGKMAASYYGFLDNYVINPKTGIPGHHPPGGSRHHHHHTQFHPPPAFPGLNSPALAADMQNSRIRHRTGGATGQRFGMASMTAASPVPVILLDPHNQPSASVFASQSTHQIGGQGSTGAPGAANSGDEGNRYAPATGSYIAEESAMEDSQTAGGARSSAKIIAGLGGGYGDDDLQHNAQQQKNSDGFQGSGGIEESTWQTSPPTGMSRENSGDGDESDVGVLGLMYQFQQAHRNHRMGGLR